MQSKQDNQHLEVLDQIMLMVDQVEMVEDYLQHLVQMVCLVEVLDIMQVEAVHQVEVVFHQMQQVEKEVVVQLVHLEVVLEQLTLVVEEDLVTDQELVQQVEVE